MPNRIQIPTQVAELVVTEIASLAISNWDFPDWPHLEVRHTVSTGLAALIRHINLDLASNGFAILSFARFLDEYPAGEAAAATTKLLSYLGTPMRVFLELPTFWRKVDVDLTRPPNRSRGTGFLPLHMDFVNAENPPDLICLLAMRTDPMGGGASVIASIDGIEHTVDPGSLQTSLETYLSRRYLAKFGRDRW